MTQDSDATNRFLPRIRQELDKLPLSEQEKESVMPVLLRGAWYLDSNGGKTGVTGYLRDDSAYFDYAGKIEAVDRQFLADGIPTGTYLRAALKHPPLFALSPEKVHANINGVVDRFSAEGLTRRSYLKAALRHPSILGMSGDYVWSTLSGVADRYSGDGISLRAYLSTALKHPPLFYTSVDRIAPHISDLVARFEADGLTQQDILRAALRQPTLFTQTADTIENHIDGVVGRFSAHGLTRRSYLKAALKQPTLLAQSPETIAANITTVVDRYASIGLTLDAYIHAALQQPPLFYLSPDTVSRHIDTVIDFYDRGIFQPPRGRSQRIRGPVQNSGHASVLDFLLKRPAFLTLADDNYGLRELHHTLADGPTDARFLEQPRHAVERELMRHLGHNDPADPVPNDGFVAGQDNPTEEQAKRFVLRALIHAGLIKGGSMER